jgi:formate C-acetyltransferase
MSETISLFDYAAATEALKETALREARPFHERNLYAAQAFRQTEGEPFRAMRVAQATSRIFDQMPIRIRRGELLVGWHPNSVPDEATQRTLNESNDYLRKQNYWVGASEGHMAVDTETVLRIGLRGIRERIERGLERLDPADPATPEKRAFYDSARVSLEAFQRLIGRYAALARELADDADEPAWRTELLETADVCDHLTENPARTFRDAIQMTWFLFLAVAIENGVSHGCFGPGRLDQYLYPFYRADRDAGRLDDAHLEALLDQFLIKCNEFDGPSMSAVIMMLGGRKPDGSDATNELSFALLDATDRVRMYFPGADVSWHADMNPEFVRRAVRLLRNGKGQPSLFNSDVIVKGLQRYGIPFEHAVDHLPSTCTETSIMGRTNPWVAWPYVNIPMCLLYALFDGKHPVRETQDRPATGLPQTYTALKEAFHKQVRYAARQAIGVGLRDQLLESWYRPFPLLSCFIQGCLENGRDISNGGALYNFLQPEAVGVSNVVDGLAAVKTLVEDERRFTLDDFRDALRQNFDRADELLRAIRKDCPKYGNDTQWINELFAEVAGAWCSSLEGYTNRFGGPVFPGFLGWTVWIGFGRETPATPDGRLAGTPLANSLAPCTGVALKGTPAMMLSAAGFDHSRGLGGMTFNVRFAANALSTDDGVERLKGLIEASLDLGIYQVQVNVVGAETLRDAQEHPENYRDLFVRIGGYLVPFTLLPKDAQDEVIARTELEI